MSSAGEILELSLWEELGKESLVKKVAENLGFTERTVYRKLEAWQREKAILFSEEDLATIRTTLKARLLNFKGIILITDDENCEEVREASEQREREAREGNWAQVGPEPFYFSPLLLKLDIPIVIVFRENHLWDVLSKTENALFNKATMDSNLPSLKSGDHVILVKKIRGEERLSEKISFTVA